MSNIYNIKTEAGRDLWERINQNYGSAVWGQVGEGIEAIEAEVEERIIKLLESLKGTCDNDCDECRPHAERNAHYLTAIQDLIKGGNK